MTPAAAAGVVVIICGACHCLTGAGPVQPCDYTWVMREPKVWTLTGTNLTVTYDIAQQTYKVQDQDAQTVVFTRDAAVNAAQEMIATLRSVGVTP